MAKHDGPARGVTLPADGKMSDTTHLEENPLLREMVSMPAAEADALLATKKKADQEIAALREQLRAHEGSLEGERRAHLLMQEELRAAQASAAAAHKRADALAAQNAEATETIAHLRQQVMAALSGPKEPVMAEVPKGHRRIITLQPYSFDGEGRQPRMVPKDHVMVVAEKDYLIDQQRKFPHLLDYEEHKKKQQAKADADAQPVTHSRDALNQVLSQVDAVLELRKQQQAELAKILTRPENLAGQLAQ